MNLDDFHPHLVQMPRIFRVFILKKVVLLYVVLIMQQVSDKKDLKPFIYRI